MCVFRFDRSLIYYKLVMTINPRIFPRVTFQTKNQKPKPSCNDPECAHNCIMICVCARSCVRDAYPYGAREKPVYPALREFLIYMRLYKAFIHVRAMRAYVPVIRKKFSGNFPEICAQHMYARRTPARG